MSVAVSSRLFALLPTRATSQPFDLSLNATARPMPDPAPVTIAVEIPTSEKVLSIADFLVFSQKCVCGTGYSSCALSLFVADCLLRATNTCSRPLFTASRATLICCAPHVRVGDRLFRQNAPHLSGFLDAYDHRPLSMTGSLAHPKSRQKNKKRSCYTRFLKADVFGLFSKVRLWQ